MAQPVENGPFKEILPKSGMLYQEDIPTTVLCKPKILPLKSVTLEKLEKMQKEAEQTVRQQQKEEMAANTNASAFGGF